MFMPKLLSAIFIFYKPISFTSILVSIFLLSFKIPLFIIFLLKMALLLFAWYILNESKYKSDFIFYQNLGVKQWQLILGTYLLDSFISILIFSLFLFL